MCSSMFVCVRVRACVSACVQAETADSVGHGIQIERGARKMRLTTARRTFKVAKFMAVVPHESLWARPVVDKLRVAAGGVHLTTDTRLVVSVCLSIAITNTDAI